MDLTGHSFLDQRQTHSERSRYVAHPRKTPLSAHYRPAVHGVGLYFVGGSFKHAGCHLSASGHWIGPCGGVCGLKLLFRRERRDGKGPWHPWAIKEVEKTARVCEPPLEIPYIKALPCFAAP
jgi:hypothetical protein